MTLEAQKESVDKYCKGVNDATLVFDLCENKCKIASICDACSGCFDKKTDDGRTYAEIAYDALQYGAVRVKDMNSAEKIMNDYCGKCEQEIERLKEQNDILVKAIGKISSKI